MRLFEIPACRIPLLTNHIEGNGLEEVFEVTDLVVERETCNSCFPYNPASNFFDQLRGYAVNGSPEFGPRIIIRRY